MVSPRRIYVADADKKFEGQDFVVNPAKIYVEEMDFGQGSWPDTLSNQGMLRVSPTFWYGPSGIQGTIGMANPPSDDMKDMWEASKPPGIWDYYAMLGFIQIPDPDEYILQVFFPEATFDDRGHEIICTITIEFPESHFDDEYGDRWPEEEWAHIYREVFVKHFDAASLAGHYWPSCPCDVCSSSIHEGICLTPIHVGDITAHKG
jgi:hypothetical protein